MLLFTIARATTRRIDLGKTDGYLLSTTGLILPLSVDIVFDNANIPEFFAQACDDYFD